MYNTVGYFRDEVLPICMTIHISGNSRSRGFLISGTSQNSRKLTCLQLIIT